MRSFGETPGKREALLNKLVKISETPVKREETPEKGEEPEKELCMGKGEVKPLDIISPMCYPFFRQNEKAMTKRVICRKSYREFP